MAVAASAVVGVAAPAQAAVNDSFTIATSNGCGTVDFVDYGAGAPGGGDNDDYLVVHDYCADGHGVKAWAWITFREGTFTGLGSRYNGLGLDGPPVYWDPFSVYVGNVQGGDTVHLKVCLVDGSSDPTPFSCREGRRESADG